MHASLRLTLALLLATAALLTGCSKSAPQPTGTYAGPHFAIRFDTTSRLTWVGQLGMPDIHATYTQDGDILKVVSDATAPKHFEATIRIDEDGKYLTMTRIKDLATGREMHDEERMSKVLAQQ